jgi:ATP-binding cassette subfamily A (ABC1) protein 3
LGHNGAGKTTAFNMMIGQVKPNEGTIVMEKGLDIKRDIESIRMKIGVCMQNDILFD